MTLEEFEKIREEKRKALLALKAEERKVQVDKDLQSMQPLSSKKENDEIFIKLVSPQAYDIWIPKIFCSFANGSFVDIIFVLLGF
jgi:plasminogen activator inhibitor 1 RNA-binding protein